MSAEYGQFIPPDPNITRFSTGHRVQRVTINEDYIGVESPWLGDFVVTDPIMYDFHTTPNALRAFGVSQLCKSRESSTIPNLASFNRESGLLNQYKGVEYFAAQQGLSPAHTRAIHIGIEGEDQTHTAFSHKLELLIQRWGGPENNHETRYPYFAELGGTIAALKRPELCISRDLRVKGYSIPEWAHATDRQDLDLDRLEYIATEALLWFDNDSVDEKVRDKVKNALKLENFEVTPDGQLAVKDPDHALVVSKLLMLFSTEHWNDPVNRAHLHLGIHGVQRTILTRRLDWMDDIDRGETRKPEPYYYGIDQDYTDALETGPGRSDEFIYLISNILNQSGMEERRRFIDYRLAEYTSFILDDQAVNYPSEYLDPKRVEFGPRSSAVHTEAIDMDDEQKEQLSQVKIPRLDDDEDHLSYIAGPLKNRYINPLVKQGGSYIRLDEARPAYKKLLREHEYLQTLGVRVTFAFTPDYAKEFRDGMRRNDVEFEQLQHATEMTTDQQRRVIEQAAGRAVKIGHEAGSLVLRGEAQSLLDGA